MSGLKIIKLNVERDVITGADYISILCFWEFYIHLWAGGSYILLDLQFLQKIKKQQIYW